MSETPLHPTAYRYQALLREHGIQAQVRMLPGSARTAAQAALEIGVQTGQIVKSLVFLRSGEPVVVLCAGDRTVDTAAHDLSRASAGQVRAVTGYAIGGFPPIGHAGVATIVDASLQRFDQIWAAAGHPHAVFPITPAQLIAALPDALVTDVSPPSADPSQ
jgi:prolyl-tRNA editing enzyme YbaK/EbsC (Cys-tRNA(Pro) deacylase)